MANHFSVSESSEVDGQEGRRQETRDASCRVPRLFAFNKYHDCNYDNCYN